MTDKFSLSRVMPLMPKISPGKTWEGALASLAGSLLTAWLMLQSSFIFKNGLPAQPLGGWFTFGICVGLFALVWMGGLGYLSTMQDLYYALYFTESNEIVTCVSTDGNGPWYIERQVHKSQIQKAELKYHDGGEHGRSSYSLRLIGNNWIENIDALGLKEDLFEECIGIKIE